MGRAEFFIHLWDMQIIPCVALVSKTYCAEEPNGLQRARLPKPYRKSFLLQTKRFRCLQSSFYLTFLRHKKRPPGGGLFSIENPFRKRFASLLACIAFGSAAVGVISYSVTTTTARSEEGDRQDT